MRERCVRAIQVTLRAALMTGALLSLVHPALAAGPAEAVAQERKQACIVASESAQQLRMEGKLVEAHKALVECASDACPGAVRADCASWLTQVNALMPSVVLVAHDAAGEDLADVTVTLDGAPLATRLDGKSVTVGPGEHVFRFERPGSAPVVKKAIVREGESARKIEVTLAATAAPPTAPGDDAPHKSSGPGVLPWIIVGVGGAAVATGLVLYLVPGGKGAPAGCDSSAGYCDNRFDDGTVNASGNGNTGTGATGPSTGSCGSTPTLNGCSRSAYNVHRQNDAGQANGWKVIGLGTAVTGGVIAAGGLVYYFVARPKASTERAASNAWLLPFVTETTRGAALGGTF